MYTIGNIDKFVSPVLVFCPIENLSHVFILGKTENGCSHMTKLIGCLSVTLN